MKASELRVNNIVLYNDIEYVISEFCETIILLDNLKPIPFTEEWIARLSMIKIGSNLQVGIITLWKNITDGMYYFRYDGISVKISFIHQIQNLCFALTGEELTTK